MNLELLFNFLSITPLPFWLLVLFLPGNRHAMVAVDLFLIVLSGLFAFQTVPILKELFPLLAKPEFLPMYDFLSSKEGFVASWNHMVLGDLWIGRWIARDSLRGTLPFPVRLIFIPIVLFFGPLGLFCYLVFRMVSRRQISLTAESAA